MTRIAVVSFIIGLLGGPIQAQAQQSYGPPVLTPAAADCALDLIEFMDSAVLGFDRINANEATYMIWRNYLASYYPSLAPEDQVWFANACAGLANVSALWPQTPPMTREGYRQAWAVSLPPILHFVEPVLVAARQSVRNTAPNGSIDPAAELQRRRDNAASLSRFNSRMTTSTIDLMHAMSGR